MPMHKYLVDELVPIGALPRTCSKLVSALWCNVARRINCAISSVEYLKQWAGRSTAQSANKGYNETLVASPPLRLLCFGHFPVSKTAGSVLFLLRISHPSVIFTAQNTMANRFVRSSKYRHVFGRPTRKVQIRCIIVKEHGG